MTQAAETSPFELALPFLLTNLLIFVSTFVIHEVVLTLTDHYKQGWTEAELKQVAPDRSPLSHGIAAVWVIDAALLPTIVGAPAIGLVLLRNVYTPPFLGAYAAVVVMGIGFFFYFLRRVRILGYVDRGIRIAGYRLSPLALCGMALNFLAAGVAYFVH